jgi:hypothetical protein
MSYLVNAYGYIQNESKEAVELTMSLGGAKVEAWLKFNPPLSKRRH